MLGVSIDALFGVEKKVSEITEEEILLELFQFCLHHNFYNNNEFDPFGFLFKAVWNIQCAYLGNESCPDLFDTIEKHADNSQITSQIINNQGTTYMSLVKDFPIFCAVWDTPEISRKILSEANFCEFFGLFSDVDALKAIIFTQTSDNVSQYTEKAIAEKMDISIEKFRELAPLLVKYGLLHEDSLMIDDETVNIYHKWSNPEIRPIFMMAYQFIHARQCYYNFVSNRTKPYFER